MKPSILHTVLTLAISMVWFVNGVLCKMLNLVPRHQQIVERILGTAYARELTFLIGLAEGAMALWIISNYKSSLSAMMQIALVASMNVLEFILAPDLLLWGPLNALFALIFIMVIYYNEFVLNKRLKGSFKTKSQ